jgi:hypothetical protein
MMTVPADDSIPILTDVVELRASNGSTGVHQVAPEESTEQTGIHSMEELAALQADLLGRTLNLTDELLHNAAREMEGVLFERVLDRLRSTLPEIVANALREHLNPGDD